MRAGCRNAAQRLLEIAHHLEAYQQSSQHAHRRATQLADLCSIAAARVDKPFDRDTLLGVVRRLAPMPPPRILLVDDAPDIAVLVRAYLKDTNCTLDVVGRRATGRGAGNEPAVRSRC